MRGHGERAALLNNLPNRPPGHRDRAHAGGRSRRAHRGPTSRFTRRAGRRSQPLARGLAALVCALLGAAPAASADETIRLTDDGFSPQQVTVDAGETLHFSSHSGESWSVTDDGGLFDSKTLPAKGAYTMTLSVPGTHVYRSKGSPDHEGRILVRSRALPGQPGDSAGARIPKLPFPEVGENDVATHPSFGVQASTTRIMLGFEPDATVADANAALADADVTIIGGMPSAGMLLVSARDAWWADDDFTLLEEALEALRASPAVRYAAMSTKIDEQSVPRAPDPASLGGGSWDWDNPFDSGNWGMVWSQFPEAWNLLENINRRSPAVITGIVDKGFEEHSDLKPPLLEIQSRLCPRSGEACRTIDNEPDPHGNHVAGIIGAAYDNEAQPGRSHGVSGANPTARMYGYSLDSFTDYSPGRVAGATVVDQQLELFELILASRPDALRVINYSIGAASFDAEKWQAAFGTKSCGPGARDDDLPDFTHPVKQICTPNNLDAWQLQMANIGLAAAPIVRQAAGAGVMIVAAAGNAGNKFCPGGACKPIDTASLSEFGWVARHWNEGRVRGASPANPILMVQSMDNTGAARADTTFGGDIAAPGDRILSTVLGNGYGLKGGSSMAAPYVTGLIGYLLADDPSLSIADVRRLVLGWAGGRPPGGAADFTWSMPDRMNRDSDGDGMVDYPTAGDLDPSGWDVELDACAASAGGKPVGTYTWRVDGTLVDSTGECVLHWKAPRQDTYSVELTLTGVEGAQEVVTKSVTVKDLVIVSVGDSIASGEGNPDISSPGSKWQLNRCHRSAFGGPAQAARWLEAADAHTSVTFLHLACSGGRIEGDEASPGVLAPGAAGIGGLLTPYEGVTEDPETSPCAASGRTDLTLCLPPQLDAAKDALGGGRTPDALLVSIGANDMYFSSILKNCLLPLNDCSTNEGGRGVFDARIGLLEARYARLASAIRTRFPDLPADRVIITQYPDPTTDEAGRVTLDCGLASGISDEEAAWAHNTVVPSLNFEVTRAASAHGWTLAAGIPALFERHGYCSSDPWMVDLTGSAGGQGGEDGAFHPNHEGHSAYADKIVESVRSVLGLTTLRGRPQISDRAPRLNAYRAVAGNGPASRVADVNDASKDGNRRVERTVAADGTIVETEDETFSHVPGERTAPDGRVDMRDLRRFRDAWLQRCLTESDGCPSASEIALDGDVLNAKRDLNLDGCVTGDPAGCGAREHWFSRFDLNGDRLIHPDERSLVPWKADGTPAADRADATRMSDLEVMASGWTGGSGAEGWAKSDIGDLVRSGDLEVHADAVFAAGASSAEVQIREKGGADVGPKRKLRRVDGLALMTVPLTNVSQEFELVATATTSKGAMSSVSEPFTLKHGEDKLMAVCPGISLNASPTRVPAGGSATSVVTATLHRCPGRDEVAGKDTTFTLEPADGGASLSAMAPQTDADGKVQAIFEPGTRTGKYTVKAAMTVADGADPLEAELELEVVPPLTVRYLWRQYIEEWQESGSTRWTTANPLQPDCTTSGVDYCIDQMQVGLTGQTPEGILRSGTLTGGGDRFALTEQVTDSGASSRASWTLSFPDGRTEDGAKNADWWVTDPDAYNGHALTDVRSHDEGDGIRLSGLQAVGDLPYHYALVGGLTEGTINPIESHLAKNAFLLIPQGGTDKLRFAAMPGEDIVFPRLEEDFKPYQSCGQIDEDLQTQPGYYEASASDYIPGAISVGRKAAFMPGDRPMPVGPGRLKVRYAFAAVAAYDGRPAPDPVLPDCTVANPPEADFEVVVPDGGAAKEGRQIEFVSRSTDPDGDLSKLTWDFGDGREGSGTRAHNMFDDDGTYTVTLTATDAKGNTDTATREVVVENLPPEAHLQEETAQEGAFKLKYHMLDPGTVDKKQLEWRITSTNSAFPIQEGTDHAGNWWVGPFTSLPAGTYPITLRVTDKDGASAEDSVVIVLTEEIPPPPPPPPPISHATCDPAVSLDAEERDFVDLVNEYREENGLAPVGVSATLTRAAERHAQDMAAEDFMEHTGSDGSTPADRAWAAGYPRSAGVGENLAESETAFEALWAWRASSTGHNENMLNPAWRATGIARAKGGMWRWATSYGTAQDCPATATATNSATERSMVANADEERSQAPPEETFEPTPTKAGVKSHGVEDEPAARDDPPVPAAAPKAEPEPEPEPAPEPAPGDQPDARASADAESGPLYAPTVAVAMAEEEPLGSKPTEFSNRSRDADGTPIGVLLRFGDTEEDQAVALAGDETTTHTYPDEQWWESYELNASAEDGAGRTSTLRRWVDVLPIRPPYLEIRHSDAVPIAGKPYTVEVEAWDQNTGDALAGLELTFTAGGQTETVLTDAGGLARATVQLLNTDELQNIEIAYAGSDSHKPATIVKTVSATINHAPIAHAGGVYVTGEGGSLALNGARSKEEDVGWGDHIAAFEWDLDGNGDHSDLAGRLPRILEGDELADLVCGGVCTPDREYPVSLRVTDTAGDSDVDTTHVRFVADFDLTLGGGAKTLVPGQSNSFTVNVIGSRSYDEPVTLSVTGLPSGVTATFSQNPVTPTDVSVLTLTGGSDVDNGTFPLRISGTDGTLTKEIGTELEVAFGLIPICYGEIMGVATSQATAEPLEGVHVSAGGIGATTDENGRYVLEQVSLGHNNASTEHLVNASRGGYWSTTGRGVATCGGITRVDVELLDVRTGTVQGRVIDKETREPLANATVSDSEAPVVRTDVEGRFERHPKLGPGNANRHWQGRAQAENYWYQDKGGQISETAPTQMLWELVPKCTATLKSGRVTYASGGAPAVGSSVAIYLTSGSRPDLHVTTDAEGRFEVNRMVSLGHNNAAINYRATPSVPGDAPPGSYGEQGNFRVTACDQEVTTELIIRSPNYKYGVIEGHVRDEETSVPIDGASLTCSPLCVSRKTDANGFYRFENMAAGVDMETGRWHSITAQLSGYYPAGASTFLEGGQTKTVDLNLLKRRYGALGVKVVDSVTGAPIVNSQVRAGTCSSPWCLYTDREGRAERTNIELNNRNAPLNVGLLATASGYWPQSKSTTIRADETATLEYELQPECEPAKVVGTVVNADTGEPIENAQVSGGSSSPAYTDATGRFEITAIKPSTANNPRQVWLTASAGGFYSQTKEITIFCGAQITVEFGSRTSKTSTIVGTVTDGDTGEPLADAFVGTNFGATAKTDAAGHYSIPNVPLGDLDSDREWTVMTHPPGYKPKTKTVVVSAEQEVRLDFTFTTANEKPTAEGQTVTLDEDTEQPITVSGSDADGDTLTYHVMRWPQHGTLSGRLPNVTYDPDSHYNGSDSFEYVVNDGVASSQTATVALGVSPVNDAPSARDDRLDAVPDTPLRIPVADLLGNDIDVDDDPLTIVEVRANHDDATVSLEGDEVVFTPPPGWASQTQYAFIRYTISDGSEHRSSAWVYIRVDHGPSAPGCADRSFDVRQDQTLSDALACTDKNADSLTYALLSQPDAGTVALASDGSFTYEPPAGFLGTTSFRFKASDGALESEPATVTIRVVADNDIPVCADVSVDGAEDSAVEVALSCSDAEADPLVFEIVSGPAHGALERVSEGRYRFVGQADWSGEDSFEFRAFDGHGRSVLAAGRVVLAPVNDAPVASDGTVDLVEDSAGVGVDLAALVADRETPDDALTYEVVSGPAKGALSGDGTSRVYTVDPDAEGADSFTYRVRDRGDLDGCTAGPGCSPSLASEVATVRLAIAPRNDLPVCADVSLATDEGTAGEVDPDCSDIDGDTLSYEVAAQGAKGQASVAGGRLRFVPAPGEHGSDTFAYVARDADGASQPAQVAVTIREATVNALPVCRDVSVQGTEDAPVEVTLACDDADGDTLSFEIVTEPGHGELERVSEGRYRFVPQPDWSGEDEFGFRAFDGQDRSAPAAGRVVLAPVNDLPVCSGVSLATDEDTAGEADPDCSDVDGDTLSYEVSTQGAKGQASVAGGRLRFVPAAGEHGSDTFAYVARDAAGASTAAQVGVTIRQSTGGAQPPPPPANRAPVAVGDAFETNEDTPLVIAFEQLMGNDTDADGDALTVSAVGRLEHGSVSLAGGAVTFVPDADFHGAARFAYAVADRTAQSKAAAAVVVTVRPVNDAPAASDDEFATDHETPIAIDPASLLANDRDIDGDALALTGVSDAADGTVAVEGGRIRFTPAEGFQGVARFRYTMSDPSGATGGGTVRVLVGSLTGSDLLLECANRSVVLEDIVPNGRRVKLLGIAARQHVGRQVQIRFEASGKVVARAKVAADGRFAASAAMPARRLRQSNRARYTAKIGRDRSRSLKLARRMHVGTIRAAGGKVTISGWISGRRAARARDRVIEVQRRTCTKTEVVARISPNSRGRFRVTVPSPHGEIGAVYRLKTKVHHGGGSRKLFPTFTLPRAVDF